MCGAAAGEIHPNDHGRKTRLHLGHVIDKSMGAAPTVPATSGAVCSVCNEGASNLTLVRPDAAKSLAQIRRAPGKDQLEVPRWLTSKFPGQTAEFLKNESAPSVEAPAAALTIPIEPALKPIPAINSPVQTQLLF